MTAVPLPPERLGSLETDRARAALPLRQPYSIRLIDRRTGKGHRINGSPLVLFSRNPEEAAATLLEGRDPAVWEARIEPIGLGARA